MSNSEIIVVKDLVKHYKEIQAVNGISFSVYEGEIFGLLGPNGAGKTTTLEIIETLREKTSGTVMVDGISLDHNPNAIKQIIGVQLQAANYYPNLMLNELLDLFAGLYNASIDNAEMLALVGLETRGKSKYKELSGGQKQRFSIATTLINKPKIVFLDEPTTGLDPQARRNLWDLIKEIRSKGTTVVITTHYMDEAEILCDRVAIIEKGKIISLNSPEKLIDNLIASGFERKKEVKSSSATVYGTPSELPLTEESTVGVGITNPYGQTKYMIEQIIQDTGAADPAFEATILRYFNPVGAHQSGKIGEDPNGLPNNLLPFVSQVAVGKLETVGVFGNDYDTPDGTGVRDYIHVVDLARGHVRALEHSQSGTTVFNLGTGAGTSVLELIASFSKACGHDIPYEIRSRRPGDIASCYADPAKAEELLGWTAKYDINRACEDSWRWQSQNPNGYK